MQIEIFQNTEGIYDIQEHKPVTFVHADNISFLRKCKDEMMSKYFHVGIVDPPYGIDVTKMNLGATKDSKPKDYERGEWDGAVPTQEYWDLLWYCCRDLIIWGGNYFTDKYGQVVVNNKPNPITAGRCFYVWDKKSDGMDFADCEIALTTIDSNARVIRRSRNSKQEDDGKKRHDTQKPVYLYDYIHLDQNLRGKRVLDTHGGSFTHSVAAYRNGVNLTIVDKQKSYFENGILNYKSASQKGRLEF